MPKTVVSFRIKPDEIAKALEGLLQIGIEQKDLNTISSIVRTTFYYGIMRICEEPHKEPSIWAKERTFKILNQNKHSKNVGLEDLIRGE